MFFTRSNTVPSRCALWPWCLGLLAVLLGVIYWFPPASHSFYPRCLLNAVTGLQCPGCGGLRATHHLLHGEFAIALRLNPLVVVAGPLLIAMGLLEWRARRKGASFLASAGRCHWAWMGVGLIVVFAILRNIVPFH